MANFFAATDSILTERYLTGSPMFKLCIVNNTLSTYNFVDADVNLGTDTITIASHGYIDDVRVKLFNTGGGLPSPLVANVQYWIVGATVNTFQLALTQGGVAIDLTTLNGGTQQIAEQQFDFQDAWPIWVRHEQTQLNTGYVRLSYQPGPSGLNLSVVRNVTLQRSEIPTTSLTIDNSTGTAAISGYPVLVQTAVSTVGDATGTGDSYTLDVATVAPGGLGSIQIFPVDIAV